LGANFRFFLHWDSDR